MNINDRKRTYKQYSENYFEKEENKVSTMSKNNYCNFTTEMIFLIKNIPDWHIYLTEKQVLITKMFLNYKNIGDIAKITNLPYGTIYSMLFGSTVKDEQGIYSKLKKVYILSNRYNKERGSIGETLIHKNNVINNNNKSIDIKEQLFKYINGIDNWRDYLTQQQIEVVELYLEHKSCSKVDKILGKRSTWCILYGKTKNNPKGIYKKLETVYNKLDK